MSLHDDLARRDFTVNAIARDPRTHEITDPFDGITDLRSGIIRAVGDPAARFREDPLRLLRAIRIAARLEFDIEENTWNATRSEASRLAKISRERIRDEYTKILQGPNPARGLELLRDSNLMANSVPELLELARMPDHGPLHSLSLWDHTMRVIAAVPPQLELRWAALLHDIAKPATRSHEPNGRPRFFLHDERGAELARSILSGLRYRNQEIDAVILLVATHMQPHAYSDEWSDGAVRRFILRMGSHLNDAVLLARADAESHSLTGNAWNSSKFDKLDERIRKLDQSQVATVASPLSGSDLMERYGRPPGPWIRAVKSALLDEVIEGHLADGDREAAWEIADRLLQEMQGLVQ